MRALALTLLAVLLAVGCASPAPYHGGITGTVLAGPACPGPARVGSPCPDRPVAVQLVVTKDGVQVASILTLEDGRFKADLAAGTYVIRGTGTGFPIVREVSVDVPPDRYIEITVHADTGIR
ncbi:MAG TPA: hypothetical protein VHG53_04095 [Candidatus Limnocylindria bacterium]|nr:hypothetical protein [Candidatus Limnocylindria bacterium]